jgi:autotransporter-associated beta strand protein
MPRNLIPLWLPVTLLAIPETAVGQLRISHVYTVGQTIPDAGELVRTASFGLPGANITDVVVSLDIGGTTEGGYNGDLYVALSHGLGYSVLLNRPGRIAPGDFGYSDDGFNVSFSDLSNRDIHLYRRHLTGNDDTEVPGGPTGIWQPDGRAADPNAVVIGSTRSAMLGSMVGQSADGEWRLLLGDASGGATSELKGWSLSVTTDTEGRGPKMFSGDSVEFLGSSATVLDQVTLLAANFFSISHRVVLEGAVVGTGSLVVHGPGELGLSGANTYSGGTRLSSGMLTVGSDAALGSGALDLEGGTLRSADGPRSLANTLFTRSTTTIDTPTALTLSGVLSGSAEMRKTGPAQLTLSAASPLQTGTLRLQEGTLRAQGSLPNAPVHVLSGATLTGGGAVGFTTVGSGATLSPGDLTGQLELGGTAWEPGGRYLWQINDATGTAGGTTGWDLAQVNGNLDITATAGNQFTFAISSLAPVPPGDTPGAAAHFNPGQTYAWRVATATLDINGFNASAIAVDPSGFANETLGGAFTLRLSGNNLDLVFAPVPEPRDFVLVTGAALGALALLRSATTRRQSR